MVLLLRCCCQGIPRILIKCLWHYRYLWQLSLMKTALGCRNIWLNFCHLQASVATNQICLAAQTFRLLWPACICSVPSCATSNLQAQPWPSSPTGLWWHVHVTTLWPLAVQVMTHWVDVTIPCHTVTTTVLTRSHLQLPAFFINCILLVSYLNFTLRSLGFAFSLDVCLYSLLSM